MDNIKLRESSILFQEAQHLLELGLQELERAEEDVVTPMVCFNTRLSVANYMRGFLLNREVMPTPPYSLDHLHQQCISIQPAFQKINLHSFLCRHEDDECYCLEVQQVEECMKTALEIQEIVQAGR